MSLLDKASLIVTPNAYKESKLYSVIPSDGSGDMTVVRATTATRVNSAGLVEVVPRNLFTYSEQFNDTSWLKGGGNGASVPTVTANTISAPNGTLTADTVVFPSVSGSAFSLIYKVPSIIGNYTTSIYLKGATGGEVIWMSWTADGVNYLRKSLSITTDWQRFDFNANISSSSSGIQFGIDLRDNQQSAKPSQTIYFWGAQLEANTTATEYFPTTTRLNIPRIDYTNGSCPSLLVEPQRTNLIRYSEQFDDATWAKTATTITSNTTISPSGVQNADTITGNGSTGVHDVWQGWTGGTNNSVSFFVKKGTSRYVYLSTSFQATVSDYSCIIVDLDTQTITSNSLGNVGFVSANIVSYANGWYRITSNTTSTISTGMYSFFGVTSNNTFNLSLYGRQVSSSNQTTIVWAGQAEAASYPTSYIPTVASSVTRNADVISKTGISSLIGQTEGTLFTDFVCDGFQDYGTPLCVNNGSTTNSIWITTFGDGRIRAELYNGAVQASIIYIGGVIGQRYKLAFAYKTNDFAMYVNGSLVGTDVLGTTFSGTTLSRLDFDYANASSFTKSLLRINSVQIYKTRLTNAEIAQLTTL